MLNGIEISQLLKKQKDQNDPFLIAPMPDLLKLSNPSEASVDLRLGRWFLSPCQTKILCYDPIKEDKKSDSKNLEKEATKSTFVRFGDNFLIHPGSFVLGATLEWLRLPITLGGYITGKSSWGRRGLIIETAAGIHPNFSGCLTLEITNVGEVPIAIYPGMPICQVFFHNIIMPEDDEKTDDSSSETQPFNYHVGHRKPVLSPIKLDKLTKKLILKKD